MTNKPVFTDVPQYFRTKISRRPLFGILRPSSTQLPTGPCKLSTMRRMASWWGRSTAREGLGTEQPAPGTTSTAREGLGTEQPAPGTTLSRTCEAKAPGITRARSGGAGAATPAQTPRSLVGGNLLGPATARMTDALVPRAQRVCDSARFIRLDYTIGKQLGAGAFASVRRGVSRQTGEAVAIKIFHRSDRTFALESVREEIRAMQALAGAECCAQLHAVYEDWESIYLVQELAGGGTLAKRVAAVGGRFSEREAAVLIQQVLTALDWVHRRGLAHRDVKLDNILLKSKDPQSEQYLAIRLCDFGLCRALGDGNAESGAVGTRQCWAPEIVKEVSVGGGQGGARTQERCDLKSDIWAVGFVLFTLLFGAEPFRNEDDAMMFPKILRGASLPACSNASPGARDLVSRMLALDPRGRPSTQEALQHHWLQQTLGQCKDKGHAPENLLRRASECDVTESSLWRRPLEARHPSIAG